MLPALGARKRRCSLGGIIGGHETKKYSDQNCSKLTWVKIGVRFAPDVARRSRRRATNKLRRLVLRLFFCEKLQNLRSLHVIWRFSQELAQALNVLLVHEAIRIHLTSRGGHLAPWAHFGGKSSQSRMMLTSDSTTARNDGRRFGPEAVTARSTNAGAGGRPRSRRRASVRQAGRRWQQWAGGQQDRADG